jgi:hypothetical protein
MHQQTSPPAGTPAAPSIASEPPLEQSGGWLACQAGEERQREQLIATARPSDAARQLQRCFPRWSRVLEHLTWRALVRLAGNESVDPNDPDIWRSRDQHAQAVLRRHQLRGMSSTRLTLDAVRALIDGQAQADRDAGLDWNRLTVPADELDEALRRAHARLPIDLEDPSIYAYRDDQRRALSRRLGLTGDQAGDLSRWVLAHADQFDAGDLRCWRIASATWLARADEQLDPVGDVERPVGVFVVPATRSGEDWQLIPVLSLDAIRLIVALGGRLERDLCSAALPISAVGELLERINVRTLHAGPKECLDSASQLSQELSRELGTAVSPGLPRDRRDRWGRLLVARRA